MERPNVSEMKAEELLPAHVAIDAQIAELRSIQGELHDELTKREEASRLAELAKRGPDFPPTQGIGGKV